MANITLDLSGPIIGSTLRKGAAHMPADRLDLCGVGDMWSFNITATNKYQGVVDLQWFSKQKHAEA